MSFKSLLLMGLILSSAFAAGPNLDNLTVAEADEVSKEFSSNFIHTTVSPASPLGDVFGFEVGIIGGLTDSPAIDRLSKQVDPTSDDIDKLPHAAIYGAVSTPFGLTAELNLIPGVDVADVELQHVSLGVKWTFSKYLDFLPLDAALRLHGAKSEMSYSDVINNASTGNTDVNATVAFDTTSLGANLTFSKKFFIIEPYAGFGFIKNSTDISVEGSASISIFNFTTASTYETDSSGFHYFLGANLNLFIFKFGAEYSNVDGIDRMSGKLSFYF